MQFRALLSSITAGLLLWPALAKAQLTATDVQTVINQAVTRALQISPNSVIAVTDREGNVLGVWNVRGGQPTDDEIASCVSKAGTASYLSSNQNAFTSRTAGFIIQQHFPAGVRNTPPGPLVGVGLSNLFFSDINKFRKPGSVISFSSTPGLTIVPVVGSSLDGSPGGVPLYKNGVLVGGVGVTGDGVPGPIPGLRSQNPFQFIAGYDKDEDIALAGQIGFRPADSIRANNVYINGIALAYVANPGPGVSPIVVQGNAATGYAIQGAPPPFAYPIATFGGVQGEIRQPIISDPISGTINGQPRLTAAEVASIINFAADRARITRAGIRLPIGTQMQVFITVENFPNNPSVVPTVLGAFRTGEATLFSWDVAVQKGRTAVGFSTNSLALSTRSVGFLAQTFYPPGLDVQDPGPYYGLQEQFSGFVRSALPQFVLNTAFTPDPRFRNGITIFPGGFPLYRNGQLIGAIGISGDGVDQDDIVGAAGTHDFLAPFEIRADQFAYLGARLPYAKFPRDPTTINPPGPPPFVAAAEKLANIATRVNVGTGDNQVIGGFIVTGTQPKNVIVRAIGPSLSQFGLGALADPTLELHDQTGALIASNDNWSDSQQAEIEATGLAPVDELESAIVRTLAPGAYTAVAGGNNGATGIAVVEVYDLNQTSNSTLANISTRGAISADSEVMIGGFIIFGNGGNTRVLVRSLGPSLASAGIPNAMPDPTLELRDVNGTLIVENDNWRDGPQTEIEEATLAPSNDLESAIVTTLPSGPYTAIVRERNGQPGIGLVEVYNLQNP
ncbi:MAG: hypothetical protein QOC70_2611 [Verrucomicrobiota bacterium]